MLESGLFNVGSLKLSLECSLMLYEKVFVILINFLQKVRDSFDIFVTFAFKSRNEKSRSTKADHATFILLLKSQNWGKQAAF